MLTIGRSPISSVVCYCYECLISNVYKGSFEGLFWYHLNCDQIILTHLCFADDLLIFLDGSVSSLEAVLKTRMNSRVYLVFLSTWKTPMSFLRGSLKLKFDYITTRFGLKEAFLLVKYLGLPRCSRKLNHSDCDPLLARILIKMNPWTIKLFSFAGRLQLLSSIISSMVTFWCSAFFLPRSVICLINSYSNNFMWKRSPSISGGARVAWDTVARPKSEGGLGIKDLQSWSNCCGLKLIWIFHFRADSIWMAWMKHKYFRHRTCWELTPQSYYSWNIRRLLKIRFQAHSFVSFVGDGKILSFWYDSWTSLGPLIAASTNKVLPD